MPIDELDSEKVHAMRSAIRQSRDADPQKRIEATSNQNLPTEFLKSMLYDQVREVKEAAKSALEERKQVAKTNH
ncbi:MAG: hypothetical protein KGH49_02840 [Candidatus Micrarchaeota archaeon]|nr:hypothetical protein [Candidatus Micrarchaeota archaeon]